MYNNNHIQSQPGKPGYSVPITCQNISFYSKTWMALSTLSKKKKKKKDTKLNKTP